MADELNIITTDANAVNVTTEDRTVTITNDSDATIVTLSAAETTTVQIATIGPAGPKGDTGAAGNVDVNTLATTGSNNFIGNQTITGSLTVSGSSTFTNIGPAIFSGSVNITNGITASLLGTASFASTASYALNAGAGAGFPYSGSAVITGSLFVTAGITGSFSGSVFGYVPNEATISFVTTASFNTFTASTNNFTQSILSWTGSVVSTASFNTFTASTNNFTQSILNWTGSVARTGSNSFNGNQTITGSTLISGSLIVTGSTNLFGTTGTTLLSSNADTLTITGSLIVTGSSVISGSLNVTNGITGSLLGTASFAINFASASNYVLNTATSSFVTTLQTSSFLSVNQTGSMLQPYALSSQLNSYLTTGSTNNTQTISGSLIIDQNLIVLGSQSIQYITSSQLNISTNLITVNTSTPAVRFGGIAVIDSGSLGTGLTGSLLWDSEHNVWIYTNPSGGLYDGGMLLTGPRNTSGIGNEVGINSWYAAIGNGNHHMTSSVIWNSGSLIRLETNTQITGGLVVSNGITGSFSGSVVGYVPNEATTSFITNSQTGSFATTGSNTFIGNQTITGSITFDGGAQIIPTIGPRIILNTNVTGAIDITAGTGGGAYASLTSNNTQSFVWVDNDGAYVLTSESYQWVFRNDGYFVIPQVQSLTKQAGIVSAGDIIIQADESQSWRFVSGSGVLQAPGGIEAKSFTGSFSGSVFGYVANTNFNSYTQSNDTTISSLNSFSQSILSWTSSVVLNVQTASFITTEQTSSFVFNVQTGSMTVSSSSFATTASYIDPTFISASAAASGFGSGGVTSINAGDGISVNQTTGNVVVTNTGGSGGISQGKVVAIVNGLSNLF